MTAYREPESGAGGLVCERCGSITVPPPGVSAERSSADGPFVCATCMLAGRDTALNEDAIRRALHAPPPIQAFGAETPQGGVLSKVGGALLVCVALIGLVVAEGYLSARPDTRSLAATFEAPSAAPAAPVEVDSAGAADPVPPRDHRSPELIAKLGRVEEARRAAVFNRYAEPLDGTSLPTIPSYLPAVWRFRGRPPTSPFAASVWGTDEALTETRVRVEADRLLLGGQGVVHGAPVTCVGAVEPVIVIGEKVQGKTLPAVFVSACRADDQAPAFQLKWVNLPELGGLLTGRAPRVGSFHTRVIPEGTHGSFQASTEDCKNPNRALIMTSSTLIEVPVGNDKTKGELALIGIPARSAPKGWDLSGLDLVGGSLCNGRLSGFGAGSQLDLTCATPIHRTICGR